MHFAMLLVDINNMEFRKMPRIKKCIIIVKYTQVCNVFIFLYVL